MTFQEQMYTAYTCNHDETHAILLLRTNVQGQLESSMINCPSVLFTTTTEEHELWDNYEDFTFLELVDSIEIQYHQAGVQIGRLHFAEWSSTASGSFSFEIEVERWVYLREPRELLPLIELHNLKLEDLSQLGL